MTIDEYILSHSDEEGALLSALNRDANVNLLRPRMLSGHLQGRILKMFCRMLRPRRVLEIGTYTGYATLCMAEGMEEGTLVHTIEINDEMEDFIMKYLKQSPHRNKIRVHFGDALDIIPLLDETFDLVFIDADKRLYSQYFDLVFPMVRAGGLILADNTLAMWWKNILRINKHSVFLVLMIKSKKTRVLKKLSYLCVTASQWSGKNKKARNYGKYKTK